jgi:hypothetical protein
VCKCHKTLVDVDKSRIDVEECIHSNTIAYYYVTCPHAYASRLRILPWCTELETVTST